MNPKLDLEESPEWGWWSLRCTWSIPSLNWGRRCLSPAETAAAVLLQIPSPSHQRLTSLQGPSMAWGSRWWWHRARCSTGLSHPKPLSWHRCKAWPRSRGGTAFRSCHLQHGQEPINISHGGCLQWLSRWPGWPGTSPAPSTSRQIPLVLRSKQCPEAACSPRTSPFPTKRSRLQLVWKWQGCTSLGEAGKEK